MLQIKVAILVALIYASARGLGMATEVKRSNARAYDMEMLDLEKEIANSERGSRVSRVSKGFKPRNGLFQHWSKRNSLLFKRNLAKSKHLFQNSARERLGQKDANHIETNNLLHQSTRRHLASPLLSYNLVKRLFQNSVDEWFPSKSMTGNKSKRNSFIGHSPQIPPSSIFNRDLTKKIFQNSVEDKRGSHDNNYIDANSPFKRQQSRHRVDLLFDDHLTKRLFRNNAKEKLDLEYFNRIISNSPLQHYQRRQMKPNSLLFHRNLPTRQFQNYVKQELDMQDCNDLSRPSSSFLIRLTNRRNKYQQTLTIDANGVKGSTYAKVPGTVLEAEPYGRGIVMLRRADSNKYICMDEITGIVTARWKNPNPCECLFVEKMDLGHSTTFQAWLHRGSTFNWFLSINRKGKVVKGPKSDVFNENSQFIVTKMMKSRQGYVKV